ncbi:helix-turn-helix domain-containing protein [Desulfosporosinus meridiei]|uniref:Helix-turn-helix conjugative transposon-like domain-containing protein n=1 Tax=Desulfosporosinus meridiei (strain ATCC BAA-275 / DSM 13257 / KCTC 12902 / NCIMB 13706 / S10) TaxID=768704 RepID=J7IVR9_DESMD|nr:helix-turn-helix domain-containing protein [Desulfosporosinus meridiei]AFQ44254.1 hypothetical protein Desmer_2323 [Desulfosporosinus meridiei DSM 13257]
MDYDQLDFETLWELLKQNDEQALVQVLIRFDSLIKSKSRVNGRINEDIAQDIREAFVKALKKKIRE